MENMTVITVFDIESRKERLRKELKEKGSVEMLHFKGNTYKVFAITKHTETSEELVAYKLLRGTGVTEEQKETFWSRPLDMFMSETDLEKHPNCQFDFRFMFLDEAQKEYHELLNGRGE